MNDIVNVDLFNVLESDIFCYSQAGSVYVFGDFNGRVGQKCDYVVHDQINLLNDDVHYIPDCNITRRASLDNTHNSHGIRLLDLCKSTGLRIMNGRLANTHHYTFLSNNGCSVIDYLLTGDNDLPRLNDFCIEEFNEWSDHAPLSFSLCCNNVCNENNGHEEIKFKWDSNLRDMFRSDIVENLNVFDTIVNKEILDKSSINCMLNDFTSKMRSIADPLFAKHCHFKQHAYYSSNIFNNKSWFDSECISARTCYKRALNQFNIDKTNDNRIYLCTCKKQYKDTVRKKKSEFYKMKMSELESLRRRKPKDFWSHFKTKNKNTNGNIPLDIFRNFFKDLGGNVFNCNNDESENFNENNDFDLPNNVYSELDRNITEEEIVLAVKSLKRGKAYGADNLLNEYFIETIDVLSGQLCKLFNKIIDTGFYPVSWSLGIIVPLHKKGDVNDVNNYRGITLVSCLSKLFTSVINRRLDSLCKENNIISDVQFGFRKGRSTVDAIFILQTLVQKYLFENKRLYVIFVDMMKCFDTIYRNGLWLKMFKLGIQGKILRIIRDMYSNVKSCVKSLSSFSDYFTYSVGLRQGEVMSPLLFSLFVEDLELYLQNDANCGLSIDEIIIILLLFADDMAIIGKTPTESQTHLVNLYKYSEHWGLQVKTNKTKTMVFQKREGLLQS